MPVRAQAFPFEGLPVSLFSRLLRLPVIHVPRGSVGLFPVILPAVGIQGKDLTVDQALSAPHTLRVGLIWWSVGMCLAVMYFCIVYWLFRGKILIDDGSYEH